MVLELKEKKTLLSNAKLQALLLTASFLLTITLKFNFICGFQKFLKDESGNLSIGKTEEFFVDFDKTYFDKIISPALFDFINEIHEIQAYIKNGHDAEEFFKETSLSDFIPEDKLKKLTSAITQIEELTKFVDTVKKEILSKLSENKIKTASFGIFKFSKLESTTRETFDSKAFKEQMPELALKFTKISKVSESIRITKNKDE